MKIVKATQNDLFQIEKLARKIWPSAYGKILSKEQLNYMLDLFYSQKSLEEQMGKQHQFYLIKNKQAKYFGFVSFEINCEPTKTKIHKIYVLPETQGLGLGKLLFEKVKEEAMKNNQQAIFLNVNKNNKAQYFYTKLGFTITKEEVIDIGSGYVMDDFVMEVKI